MRLIYSLLWSGVLPLALLRLYWKGRKVPAYRERWGERLGLYSGLAEPGAVWFHAVSVGEAEAAFPLLRRLVEERPTLRLLVTCTTPTGSARIRAVLGDRAQHVYLPFDHPACVSRFLDRFRPRMAVILETELWPNLFLACRTRGIPLAILNARLSERSVRRYGWVRPLVQRTLAAVTLLQAQTAADARRYLSLGIDPEKVEVSGNIKFAVTYAEADRQRAATFRQSRLGQRPVWIAGSTHPGEEEFILRAGEDIRRRVPDALLLLAPRHPERTPELLALFAKAGWSCGLKSQTDSAKAQPDVLLIDTLGELRWLYGAADVAFIGGSLVRHGGHNLLEPAIAGLPVLFGPHVFNFAEIARGLTESGGGLMVVDARALAEAVVRTWSQPEVGAAMGKAALHFVEANRGALDRAAVAVIQLLDNIP